MCVTRGDRLRFNRTGWETGSRHVLKQPPDRVIGHTGPIREHRALKLAGSRNLLKARDPANRARFATVHITKLVRSGKPLKTQLSVQISFFGAAWPKRPSCFPSFSAQPSLPRLP